MVFSSVPLYLDPPNWNSHHQHQHHHQQQQQQMQQLSHGHQFLQSGGGGGLDVHLHHHHHQQQHQQQHQLPPVPPSTGALMAPRPDMGGGGSTAVSDGGGGGQTGGSSGKTAGSMTDRARMAKIPQPETGLKCPRCESTNTKFCYFNNYSLSQPRHLCKTCRRYWTRGGALRNVPVGGGFRRNKRTKSSSKTSSASSSSAGGMSSSSTSFTTTGGGNSAGAAGAIMPPQGHAQMPFLFAPLHPVGGGDHYSTGASRLGFPGLSSLDPADYQFGGAAMGLEQWRLPAQMQQFPFFSRTDGMQQQMAAGIYPFNAEAGGDASGFAAGEMQLGGGAKLQVPGSAGLITQLASVKMEDNPPPNAMAREFLGLPGNLQFWGGGGNNDGAGGNDGGSASGAGAIDESGGGGGSWVDLSGFNSSSSGNML